MGSSLNNDGSVGLNHVCFIVRERSWWNLQEMKRPFLLGALATSSLTCLVLTFLLPKSNTVQAQLNSGCAYNMHWKKTESNSIPEPRKLESTKGCMKL